MLGRAGTLVRKNRRASTCSALRPPEVSRRGSAPMVLQPSTGSSHLLALSRLESLSPNSVPCKSVSFCLEARGSVFVDNFRRQSLMQVSVCVSFRHINKRSVISYMGLIDIFVCKCYLFIYLLLGCCCFFCCCCCLFCFCFFFVWGDFVGCYGVVVCFCFFVGVFFVVVWFLCVCVVCVYLLACQSIRPIIRKQQQRNAVLVCYTSVIKCISHLKSEASKCLLI